MKAVLRAVNLPRAIAKALLGKDHSERHRIVAGIFVMAVGVLVSHIEVAHLLCETVGFGLHGLGLVPFVEGLLD